MADKKFQVATSWLAYLFFKLDLTIIGLIKNKYLTKIGIKYYAPSKIFLKTKLAKQTF